jgi:hypothetical protein
VRWQTWQRTTGSWVTVTGKRREAAEFFIKFYNARRVRQVRTRLAKICFASGITGTPATAGRSASRAYRRECIRATLAADAQAIERYGAHCGGEFVLCTAPGGPVPLDY